MPHFWLHCVIFTNENGLLEAMFICYWEIEDKKVTLIYLFIFLNLFFFYISCFIFDCCICSSYILKCSSLSCFQNWSKLFLKKIYQLQNFCASNIYFYFCAIFSVLKECCVKKEMFTSTSNCNFPGTLTSRIFSLFFSFKTLKKNCEPKWLKMTI